MTTIYLAGPDVFLPNAREVLEQKRFEIVNLGLNMHVLTPFDFQSINPKEIRINNEDCVFSCDIVVADVQPFRGTEPDSGTVYEIGYARALGKDVITYNNPIEPYNQRLEDWDHWFDTEFLPESFGLKQNLMISCSVKAELQSFKDVLEYLKTHCGKHWDVGDQYD